MAESYHRHAQTDRCPDFVPRVPSPANEAEALRKIAARYRLLAQAAANGKMAGEIDRCVSDLKDIATALERCASGPNLCASCANKDCVFRRGRWIEPLLRP